MMRDEFLNFFQFQTKVSVLEDLEFQSCSWLSLCLCVAKIFMTMIFPSHPTPGVRTVVLYFAMSKVICVLKLMLA